MLQKRVVRRPTVPLQRRGAQVGGEVGAGEEGDPLLEGRKSQSLSVLLACCALERTARGVWVQGHDSHPEPRTHGGDLQQQGQWQEVPR